MISVDEALQIVEEQTRSLQPAPALEFTVGRLFAEDVIADSDLGGSVEVT